MNTTTLDRAAARGLPARTTPTIFSTIDARGSHGPAAAAAAVRQAPAAPAHWDRVRFAGEHDDEAVTPTSDLPAADPAQWAGALARAAIETLQGVRPPTQLSRVMTAGLYDALARRAGLAVRVLGRPRRAQPTVVRRVLVCEIVPGVVEAAVVVHDGTRVRAAAVRLRVHRGRWRATALEIG
ncbi:MAG: Rv3235 family protein [Georgenia sp.]